MLFLKIARPGLGANLGSFFNYDNEVPQTSRLPRLLSSLKHKFLSLPLSLLFQSLLMSMMNSFIYLKIDFWSIYVSNAIFVIWVRISTKTDLVLSLTQRDGSTFAFDEFFAIRSKFDPKNCNIFYLSAAALFRQKQYLFMSDNKITKVFMNRWNQILFGWWLARLGFFILSARRVCFDEGRL